jgi:glutamyl endopeptidase
MSASERRQEKTGKKPPKDAPPPEQPRSAQSDDDADSQLHAETSHEIGSPYRMEAASDDIAIDQVLPEFQAQVQATYAAGQQLRAAGSQQDAQPIDAWYASYGTRLSRVLASRKTELSIAEMMAEVIIDRDDRLRVRNTTAYPFGCICQLSIRSRNGARFVGTGWLVDDQTVITAGHCLYMHREGGWAAAIDVYPGQDGATYRPYHGRASRLWTTRGWTDQKSPPADYGAIRLDQKISAVGTFGYGALADAELRSLVCHIVGYPADKQGEMWGHGRRLSEIRSDTLTYDIDTYGGNSGGPVFLMRGGKPLAVGIHNYGDLSGNSATRITPAVYERIQGWVES